MCRPFNSHPTKRRLIWGKAGVGWRHNPSPRRRKRQDNRSLVYLNTAGGVNWRPEGYALLNPGSRAFPSGGRGGNAAKPIPPRGGVFSSGGGEEQRQSHPAGEMGPPQRGEGGIRCFIRQASFSSDRRGAGCPNREIESIPLDAHHPYRCRPSRLTVTLPVGVAASSSRRLPGELATAPGPGWGVDAQSPP
jgi:hypothetical protein